MLKFRAWLENQGGPESLNRGNTFDQGDSYGNHGLPVRSKYQQKDDASDEQNGLSLSKPDRLFGFKGNRDELLKLQKRMKV